MPKFQFKIPLKIPKSSWSGSRSWNYLRKCAYGLEYTWQAEVWSLLLRYNRTVFHHCLSENQFLSGSGFYSVLLNLALLMPPWLDFSGRDGRWFGIKLKFGRKSSLLKIPEWLFQSYNVHRYPLILLYLPYFSEKINELG